MVERVPIAHFADPGTADLAAGFLVIQGLDAVALEKSGFRAAGGGIVLVPRAKATEAVALLHRVRKGDFADPDPDLRAEDAEAFIHLTRALQPSGFQVSWLHHLPVIVLGSVVVLGITLVMVWAALTNL
jgi:hypothetical protein